MISFRKTVLTLVSIILSLHIGLYAQSISNTLIITVEDQAGGLISGAEITLLSKKNAARLFKTGPQGTVEITGLTEGEYSVKVSSPGFTPNSSEKFVLRGNENRKMKISLNVALIESEVKVSSDQGIDTNSYGSVTVLNKADIESLPDDPAELARVLKQIYGDNLQINVNGISGANVPAKQRIKQIRINQNVFSAQYESVSSGGIDIITESEMEKFEGYAYTDFSDSRLTARDPFLGRSLPFQSGRLGLGIAGPLGKKTSISIDGMLFENDSSAVINATILDAALHPINVRQSIATPRRVEDVSGTINSDAIYHHKIYLNYEYNTNRQKNSGVGGLSLASRAAAVNGAEHTLDFVETYTPSPKFFNQTTFHGKYQKSNTTGLTHGPGIIVLDSFAGGGSQRDIEDSKSEFRLNNDSVRTYDRFTLGFGFMIRGQSINQLSRTDFGGAYTFSGRKAPELDANNQPVTDGTGNFILTQISSLESYRRALLFQSLGYSGGQIRSLGGGASQFTIAGGNPSITASQYDYSAYLQNSISLKKTLGLSFGLRYENQTNIKSNLNFAPRIGLIWAPKVEDKDKTKLSSLPRISLGFGVFYSRYAVDNVISEREANDPDRSYYVTSDENILNLFPAVPTINDLVQSRLPRSLRFRDPALQTSMEKTFNVNVVKGLPKNFMLNISFSHTEGTRGARTQNINAPLAGTFDAQNPDSGVYPYGRSGSIFETFSKGKTDSSRFSALLNFPRTLKFFNRPVYLYLNYVYNKSRSDIVDGSSSLNNPYDFKNEFAPTANDGVHAFTGFLMVGLPGRVNVSGYFSIQSGSRFNITTGRDTNGDGFYSERPAFATDPNKSGIVDTIYGLLDPNPSANDRLIPRNLGRGPMRSDFNLSISKNVWFNINQKTKQPGQRLVFRMQITNVLNVNNKSNPIGNMSSPNFLKSITGYGEGGVILSNPRRITLGADFYF